MPLPVEALSLPLPDGSSVSALLDLPTTPAACYVFAHGAGAGMQHPFMQALAQGLAQRGLAVLRFQFPFIERGARRPDPPALAQDAVRAAVAEAGRRLPGVPLFAGGKSFGGRMSSQAQAQAPMPAVRGLIFVGFPLHVAGKPGIERARHLEQIEIPLLFLQGTRDPLADLALIRDATQTLRPRATLHVVDGADHSFHVLARSGRTDAQVREELVETIVGWTSAVAGAAH